MILGTQDPLVGGKIKIFCTLGPSSLNPEVIESLERRGVDLFRINLSHTPPEEVDGVIGLIRRYASTRICLDTQGPQVRSGKMTPDVVLVRGTQVTLTTEPVAGTATLVPLTPASVFDRLETGSKVMIDFDAATVEVTGVGDGHATAVVVDGGRVRSSKAVTIEPAVDLELPCLSEDDKLAIAIGSRRGIDHYALSFAARAEHVALLRGLAPPGSHIIAKIESRAGVRNMDSIIHAADSVLVDRGDLSREIAIEQVPYVQKAIARRANRWNRPVYVATNLLESMITNRLPTIAEANDVANTLLDGVHGLVLAAETAVGFEPVGAVDMVLRAVKAFERSIDSQLLHAGASPESALDGERRELLVNGGRSLSGSLQSAI
jgi:pyruvate kinase